MMTFELGGEVVKLMQGLKVEQVGEVGQGECCPARLVKW